MFIKERVCEGDLFNEKCKGFYIWLLLVGKRRSMWIAGPHVVGTFHWSKAGRLQKQPQRRADTTTPSPSFLLLLVYYTRSLSLFLWKMAEQDDVPSELYYLGK